MDNCNPISTPADTNAKLVKEDSTSKLVDGSLYRAMVGSLLYISNATQPDIANAVGVVSLFNSKPNQTHLTAVKRIMRYLKGTIDMQLSYTRSPSTRLLGYADADWAGDIDMRRSTSGNVFIYANGAISYMSKRQTTTLYLLLKRNMYRCTTRQWKLLSYSDYLRTSTRKL